METANRTVITIEALIDAPVQKVWEFYTGTDHIVKWNTALPEWHSPKAEHDLRPGGNFNYRMEARDGSMGFDFVGVFDEVSANERIRYTLGDGRRVDIRFTPLGNQTKVVTQFEAEDQNPHDMQQFGWQSILNNFKKYAEENNSRTV